MRKIWLPTALLLGVFVAATFSGTVQGQGKDKKKETKAKPAPYVHCVIFYLKKDAPKGAAEGLVKDAHELLAKIPTVKSMRIGPPAEKSTPKVAVTDYQIGLLCLFDNYEGLQTYLDHPLHLKYVERHEKNLEKVLVYDFLQGK